MKEKIIENGIEYVKSGDYYIPNLKAPEGTYNIGRYGKLIYVSMSFVIFLLVNFLLLCLALIGADKGFVIIRSKK